ncbi:SCO6880 family protein [Leifsonia sp. TF02-11]|uniref:SCO6880 family protein n=1 Tax=Leifsonia sp. TF02-11 TaxID=2815212 RepID=UPI001AA16F3F|nr:SCO6880 family protein [Leifsonia sp. TF02-11]MBO1740750.1 hypothetical protein [Leifsonia sp. TF02-11]
MSSTAHSPADPTRPVRLPHRSRQGIVLGLDGWQLTFLIAAAAVLLIGVNRFGPPGLLYAVPIYVPLGATALITVHGLSAPKMLGLWLSKQVRHSAGATVHRYRPEQQHLEGTLNLPGTRASVQLWGVDGMASAYHAGERTVSITAELEVQGFLMKDAPERLDLAQQWAPVLASLTQRPGIKRVTLQERTTRTTIRPARDHYEAASRKRMVDPAGPAAANYREVLDASEQFAVGHRNYLTLTLDLVALGAQLKALGGGKQAIQALSAVEAGNLAEALRAARITVRAWLGPRELAELARTAFDPESIPVLRNRTGDQAGVDPSAIGPMYLEEPRGRNGIVYTESAVHTTMWIHEWPRSDAPVGFLAPLVFARHPVTNEAVTHILSIVAAPIPVGRALKNIRDEKKVWRGNERLRAKRGTHGSIVDESDWLALEQREQELVAGHGEFSYGAYLTVSADTEQQLEQAIAGARNALSVVGMEAQILYCQQAEALLLNAIPLGLGMK